MKTKRTLPSEFVQRKKLLKDAWQQRTTGKYVRGRTTVTSPREVRKSVAQLFAHKPLIQLTQEEQSLLKAKAKLYLTEALSETRSKANDLLNGNAVLINGPSVHAAFSQPSIFETAEIAKIGSRRGIAPFGLRSKYDIDVDSIIEKAQQRKKKIKLLDIGSGNNSLLARLKKKFGDTIETHALALDDLPHYPVDHMNFGLAERMPVHFKEKFDVITTHWQIEYSDLPHLVLKNIANALTQNGEAHIHIHPYYLGSKELAPKLNKYYNSFPLDTTPENGYARLERLQEQRVAKIKQELDNLTQSGKFEAKQEGKIITIRRLH